jgi:ABC-type Fe3+/spermidine/putrescine transport system ATPase subunit
MCRQVPITTILVTHDQSEGLTLADEIVVMREGRIEQTMAPRDGDGRWPMARSCRRWNRHRRSVAARPGAATLMVRQEHVRLLAPGAAADVSTPAEVAAVAYRGQSAQVAVQAFGQRLRLTIDPHTTIHAGDAVRVGWALADSRLIR